MVAVLCIIAEPAVVLLVNLAYLVDQRMLQDADAGISQNLCHLLGLSQHIRLNDRRAPAVQGLVDNPQQLGDDFFAWRQAILRVAEGAFHDEHVGFGGRSFFRGCRRPELEVPRVQQPLIAVGGEQHRGAENVSGGKCRQLHIVPLLDDAERHGPDGPHPEAELVQRRRRWRAESQLVLRHVVRMGVGDESPRLAAAKIDREIDAGQLEPAVVVEHGVVGKSRPRKAVGVPPIFHLGSYNYFAPASVVPPPMPASLHGGVECFGGFLHQGFALCPLHRGGIYCGGDGAVKAEFAA